MKIKMIKGIVNNKEFADNFYKNWINEQNKVKYIMQLQSKEKV